MISQDLIKYDLPDSPGVYYFLGPKKQTLYVGKATSLKDRVKSYFVKDLIDTRGERIVEMVERAGGLAYKTTDSVLEALILEANEIHAHRPPYNTLGKDDKTFNYVVITDESFPRVLVIRERELEMYKGEGAEFKKVFGPFPHGSELKSGMKIIRRIFPYRDNCTPAPEQRDSSHPKACWNAQIGLCPGVCTGRVTKREYGVEIRRLALFFEGKKEKLLRSIERDMQKAARGQAFEEANKLKRTLYALEHIQDVALIKRDVERGRSDFRIEAYDVAHLGGSETVGVMTVVEDGELAKSQYRKFRIRGVRGKVGIDDTANLKEVLRRRFTHPEWAYPQLIVVDGGAAQLNAAKDVLNERGMGIGIVSVVKDVRHKAREILGDKQHIEGWSKSVLLANAEAHRFAITYHRKLRSKGFRI